jgi:hypothetical protein
VDQGAVDPTLVAARLGQTVKMVAPRVVPAVGLAIAAALALTGCDPAGVFSQPSLLRIVDGDVELMVCDAYEPDDIEGLVKSSDGVREYFWKASSGTGLQPGDVISTATLADLFDEVGTAYAPDAEAGENVAIRINDRSGGYQKVFSFVVTSEILDGVWASPWGESVPDGTCEALVPPG